jgi:regulation of enolase protein 1 (concanavalin A-like superfamily)
MVRLDERKWIKAGIEKSDGQCLLSSVLTVDRSDWATGTYDGDPADFWMRATVSDGVIRVQVSSDGQRWPLVRLAPFPRAASYRVGPMCCTPERAGLEVVFSSFRVTPPLGKDLHDLS